MSGLKLALSVFWSPVRAMGEAAEARRFVWPLLLATLMSVAFLALTVPRMDLERTVEQGLDRTPAAASMTPHERVEAVATGKKVAIVGGAVAGVVGPALSALFAALALWIGFKVAGGAPAFGPTFAVAAHALLPGALRELLSLPAALRHPQLTFEELPRLLPSNLAVFAPERVTPATLSLLSSIDLFAVWGVVLAAAGMTVAARVSRWRAALTVLALWISFVLVVRFAIPSLGPG